MPRQEWRQMRLHADRPDTWSAAAVRNTKSLVQIQVRDVAAEFTRRAQADHRIHVGAVDIHLATVGMHDVADFAHRNLKNPVGRRIGNHNGGELVAVLFRPRLEVGNVDVALIVAFHHHHLHAHHLCTGRVGAVSRTRYQTDLAMAFTTAVVPGA